MKKRRAAVMTRLDDVIVTVIPMPELKDPDDVLIKIKSVGVCGSDIHFYKEGHIGPRYITPPHVLGHESAGEVVAVGTDVVNLKVGDRVALEPGRPCGKCEQCIRGKYNLCKDMRFMAASAEGAFVEYCVRPAHFCFKLPDSMSFDEGAMLEPLAVALQSLKLGHVKIGDSLAILGAGPIALAILMAARAAGATRIYLTDTIDYRLEKAMEMGATGVFNVTKCDYVKEIKDATGGRGVDAVIETTGSDAVYKTMTDVAMRGGTIALVGMGPQEYAAVNIAALRDNELTLTGVFRYENVYQDAVNLVASGLIDIKQLITHVMPLDDIKEAFETVFQKKDNVIKVVIHI